MFFTDKANSNAVNTWKRMFCTSGQTAVGSFEVAVQCGTDTYKSIPYCLKTTWTTRELKENKKVF